MKKLTFLIFSFLITSYSFASNIEVQDTIKVNTTWSSVDTVKVTGNMLVNNLTTLTIEPGIIVEFQGLYDIVVKGTVKAIGTETDSIVFTASEQDTGWGHFLLSSVNVANDTTVFSHCIFEHSKTYRKKSGYTDGASLYLSHANNLEISNCTFRYNKGSNSVISLTTMAINIHDNTFYKNESYGILTFFAVPVEGNRIFNNKFLNNTGSAAIYSGQNDATIYSNNLMIDNKRGYFLYNSSAQILNNTITGSSILGILLNGNSDATFQNCILWDNFMELQINDTASDPDFYNCDIDGGSAAIIGNGSGSEFTGVYSNCLNVYPEFSDTSNNNFSLAYTSPCKDVGLVHNNLPENDLSGSNRICDDAIDLGPYEYFVATDTVCNETWGDVEDTIHLTGNVIIPDGCSLTILPGTKVIADGFYKIVVRGKINALGAEEVDGQLQIDSIYFTAANKDEGWRGIKFPYDNGGQKSIFSYCIFDYGKPINHNAVTEKEGGAFYAYGFDSLEINNCYFRHNEGDNAVIYGTNSTVNITNCKFEQNNNYSILLVGDRVSNVSNNKFINNIGFAIYTGYSDSTYYYNNLFANNNGGYSCYDSKATIVNNTIYGSTFEPIRSSGGSAIRVYNTITSGNSSAISLYSANDDPNFYNCNIEGGMESFTGNGSGSEFTGDYIECLDTFPKFVDSLNYDFRIKVNSPLVNMGTVDTTGLFLPEIDLAGAARISIGRIDIGAYEADTNPIIATLIPDSLETTMQSMQITLTFNKAITRLELADFIVTNGTIAISDTLIDNLKYKLTAIANTFGIVNIQLSENSVSDIFGNSNNLSSTSFTYLEKSEPEIAIHSWNSESFNIYPNPVKDILYVETDNVITLTFMDITGKIVMRDKIAVDKQINLKDLKAGMYFLKIESEGISQTKRIIKR